MPTIVHTVMLLILVTLKYAYVINGVRYLLCANPLGDSEQRGNIKHEVLCLKEQFERYIGRVVKAHFMVRLLKILDRALDGCNQVLTKPNAKQ